MGIQEELLLTLSNFLAERNFAIAGGWAVKLHGVVERPTADIDAFTDEISSLKES